MNPSDFAFGDAGNGMVFGGIQSRGNNPFDILGDVFLKVSLLLIYCAILCHRFIDYLLQSIYAVFDQDNTRIGVAQRTNNVEA